MSDARETAEERAERRRRTWSGGIVSSFAELERVALDQALRTSTSERIRTVTELVVTFFDLRSNDGSPPRLSRSVGGVRPRRG